MDIIEIDDWVYFINIEWKPLVFEGNATNYEVNNIGDVRNKLSGKILSPYIDRDGYKHVSIIVNGNQYHRGVHRFVAQAFIPNPDNKPQVNHINGNKQCNWVGNLEWVTCSENAKHAFSTGLKHAILGSNNVLSHYTDDDINDVCRMLASGVSNKKISQITGVDRKYITDIKKGRRWKHISRNYNIKQKKRSKDIKRLMHPLHDTKRNIANIHSYENLISKLNKDLRVSTSTTIENGYIIEEELIPCKRTISRVKPKLMR